MQLIDFVRDSAWHAVADAAHLCPAEQAAIRIHVDEAARFRNDDLAKPELDATDKKLVLVENVLLVLHRIASGP
jgi:hypothetical protein